MSGWTTLEGIYHGTGTVQGRIRFAPAGIAWKATDNDETVTVAGPDIKYAQWIRVARRYQLRLIISQNRARETFEGFLREDHDKLASVIKQHYSITLETKEISVKGWNWGETDVRGGDLAFLVSKKEIFEIPLSRIANSNIAGKTEVSLEFTPQPLPPGTKKSRAVDELVEMRLYVPGSRVKGSDDEQSDAGDDETSAAQAFHDLIKEKAEIGQVTGEGIVTFSDILVQTPRGRYDIDMFPSFLRLRGKTYDYKILYSSITRIFLLPKPDEIHVQLVIGLDPAIRQGQTRYPYLVLLFSREEELDTELNIDQETIDTKYEGKLQKKYDLPTYRVVSEVFRGLSGKKMIAPGTFASRDNQHGIKANMKAVLGELYFLEKSLIFVAKQPTVVDYADISQVAFSRVGGGLNSARTFDMKIVLKDKHMTDFSFTSINKEEFEPVESFLTSKKIRTKNEISDGDVLMKAVVLEDSDDEDMGDDSDDSRPKRKGGDFDDEDSEVDQDFAASESDAGSPTDTDSDDSGASDDSNASGDLDVVKNAAPKKKKKKAKEEAADGEASPVKKKKKVKKDEDGDAEMADASSKPKPKPKPKPKAKASEDSPDAPAKKKPKLED